MKQRTIFAFLLLGAAPFGCARKNLDTPAVCGESDASVCTYLSCTESVQKACADGGCRFPTWDAVLAANLCTPPNQNPANDNSTGVMDCGNYHVLLGGGEGGSFQYYYDRTTGMLVAETAWAHTLLPSCDIGPASGFTPPDCGGGVGTPSPACPSDGGVDVPPSDAMP
jgi:hypothetical protein